MGENDDGKLDRMKAALPGLERSFPFRWEIIHDRMGISFRGECPGSSVIRGIWLYIVPVEPLQCEADSRASWSVQVRNGMHCILTHNCSAIIGPPEHAFHYWLLDSLKNLGSVRNDLLTMLTAMIVADTNADSGMSDG